MCSSRRLDDREVWCVLIDSVQSHANRMEEALLTVLSDDRTGGGELVMKWMNAEFLRFAAHWGFMPRACRSYRAQTKGKVERPSRYLRDSFFYGREFVNDEDLNQQALRWRDFSFQPSIKREPIDSVRHLPRPYSHPRRRPIPPLRTR